MIIIVFFIAQNPADDTASYFVKFPSFIKRKQLEDHIESHGFGDIIIGIEMHCINASNKRPAGSAKISIMPASLHDEFISALNGSRLLGKHYLSVEPYYERKQRRTIEPPRKASQTKQKPLVKEPCVVFVGPVLPNYINRAHIQAHFREYKDTITDIQFKGDRQRRGCHVLLTFKSSSSAMRAIDGYNHTSLLGKHKIKLDIYEPHHPMPSSASCPTMSVSTASAVRTPNTKSKQASSTEIVSSSILKDETHGNINIKHQSVGGYSMGQLSSSCDLEIRSTHGAAVVNKELVSNYSDSEEDQLQNTVTTVIIENLDSSVTQEEIESLTGVVITCYTPSHLTPSKVAAWVEVANSKCAYTVAEKLDGRVIYGKEVYCSLTDSHTMQQQMHNFSTFIDPPEKELPSAQSVPPSSLTDSHVPQLHIQSFPTFEDPHKEPLHLSQTIPPSSVESFMSGSLTSAAQQNTHSSPTFRDPPQEQVPMPRTISDHIVQQEYLTLFYLGDQHSLQQPQATFPQESTAPFVIPSNLQLPKHEPGPPITATPL